MRHQGFGAVLGAHRLDRLGRRPDEGEPCPGAGARERRVLGEEAVAGMDRLGAGTRRGVQDRIDPLIAFRRRRRADASGGDIRPGWHPVNKVSVRPMRLHPAPASVGRSSSLLVAAVLVLSACASARTDPPGGSFPTPASSTTATPTRSANPASGSSRIPIVEGQIVFEDAGHDFQFSQIWIENADGSNVRQLVSDDFTDGGPSLSPDGRQWVFYQGYPGSLEEVLADPNLFGRIMLVNVDGSGLHELQTGNRANRCDASAEGDAWSPDGRRVVFTRTCFDQAANFVGSGIWTINVDGTDAREVTKSRPAKYLGSETWASHLEDHRASWSPDGKELVFERIDTSTTPERAAIFTVGTNGKGLGQVTPWELDANDPVWSPDGSLIAFNSPAEQSRDQNIYTIHPDGTGATQVTTHSEDGQATFHPSWSPDGTQILFSHSPSTDGWADFFVMNRDGSGLHILAATPMHENHAYWGRNPSS